MNMIRNQNQQQTVRTVHKLISRLRTFQNVCGNNNNSNNKWGLRWNYENNKSWKCLLLSSSKILIIPPKFQNDEHRV